MADQSVLSLGNFLTSVLLARAWHDPKVYGVYALCLTVINFLNTLHASLVTYPLTVRGAACDDATPAGADRLRRLTGRALTATLCLAPLLALGLVFPVLKSHRWPLLPWVAAALVFWQVQEALRRAMLARLRHARAVPGDAISYLGQAAAVWLLSRAGWLTPESAFAAIGLTSLAAAVLQAVQMRAAPLGLREVRPTAVDSWGLGRWLLLTNLVNVGLIYLTPWVLTGTHGTGEMARFTALANVLGLTNPVVMCTCGLIVPAVAAARAGGGGPAAGRRAGLKYILQGMALLLPYYVLLLACPAFVLRVFYGPGSPYLDLGPLLRVFALGYAGAFAGQVLCAVLNGMGATRGTFLATVVGGVSSAALSVPLVIYFGLRGAVWSGVGPICLQAVVAGVLVLRARGGAAGPAAGEADGTSGAAGDGEPSTVARRPAGVRPAPCGLRRVEVVAAGEEAP